MNKVGGVVLIVAGISFNFYKQNQYKELLEKDFHNYIGKMLFLTGIYSVCFPYK